MTEFLPEIMIRESEAEAIARGLYAVAKADGNMHPRELALISEYYAAGSDGPSDFAALERSGPIAPEALAAQLDRPEVRELFVKTALLMAYTDGTFGKGEGECINRYAAALGLDAAAVEALDTQVREYLISQLTHLANVDAVVEVSKELKH
jgi:tellurite resistance protein